ncbi:MAG: ABC transporter substrate-binding protein [Acidobacteria bacterium]|nr:ABC transporter substrate-binding protein [Acidobacteriota bacterium]
MAMHFYGRKNAVGGAVNRPREADRALLVAVLVLLAAVSLASCQTQRAGPRPRLRLGYFANLTHAQALIGLANGEFQRHLGSHVEFVPKLFGSGPAAIEALLADEVDLTYVGPSPAINGFIRSEGKALRVIAGAAQGGAVFVRRADVVLNRKEDFAGKRFASPQIGNTQDISLRTYLAEMGHFTKERGGSVEVLPMANADILTLFLRQELDGAWVPEPWGAILVHRAQAVILVDERDLWPNRRFATTLLVASQKVLDEKPEWVQHFVNAHVELTHWIQGHHQEIGQLLNQELARHTRKRLDEGILADALSRLEVTFDPLPDSLETFFKRARKLRYLKKGDLKGILELRYLEQARREADAAANFPTH